MAGAIVPLQVGVLQLPIPSARRCFKLGKALRKAIESFPRTSRWRSSAPGGLSTRSRENAPASTHAWDMEFIELLEKDSREIDRAHHRGFPTRAAWRARRS